VRTPAEWQPGPMFSHTEPPSGPTFTWTALVAVGVACILIGLVGGFQWGRRSVVVPAPAPAVAQAKPADTEVPVAQDPAPRATPPALAAGPASEGRAAASGPGRITVRSTPSGAMLLVDGHPHGQTPATVKDLSLGPHTIEVARPGYVPRSERITLSAGRAAQTVALTLRAGRAAGAPSTAKGAPASSLGSIYVDSRPRGARVMIDGRFVGVSPLRVPALRAGDYTVQLDLSGHLPFSTKVALKASEQARVTATLEERNKD